MTGAYLMKERHLQMDGLHKEFCLMSFYPETTLPPDIHIKNSLGQSTCFNH